MTRLALTEDQLRSRKRKAVLAGGLVLGLGAAATLAAWTDNVWVSGSFSAGTFNIQGAVDANGTAWQEYDMSEGAGPLSFTVAPTAMAPGDSVYAPLHLRIGPVASEYNGAISLPTAPVGPALPDAAANDAFFNALRVSLFNVAPTACDEAGTSGPAIDGFSNVPLNTATASTILTLDKDMTPEGVCFKVTLPQEAPPTVQGGQTGALTWQFHATSVED